jgi:hypothetical protein
MSLNRAKYNQVLQNFADDVALILEVSPDNEDISDQVLKKIEERRLLHNAHASILNSSRKINKRSEYATKKLLGRSRFEEVKHSKNKEMRKIISLVTDRVKKEL